MAMPISRGHQLLLNLVHTQLLKYIWVNKILKSEIKKNSD